MLQRQPNADGTLPQLSDDGTEPNLIQAAGREWGVPSLTTWGGFPATSASVIVEPTLAQLEAAQESRYDGSYYIQSIGDQRLLDLMTALAAGFPVVNAIPGGGSMFQGYSGGILGAVDGPIDHATYFYDYKWDGKNVASLVVWGANSWGSDTGWGETGTYRCNKDFINQDLDLEVMDISRLT